MNDVPESVYGPDKDFGKLKIPPEILQQRRDLDVLIAKTFSSHAGAKVLKWLRDQYIDGPVEGYVLDRNGSINSAATTFRMYQRDGQRILIKNIEMRIKRGKSPAPSNPS